MKNPATVVPIKPITARSKAGEPPAPRGLSAEARRLWRDVLRNWSLEPPALVLLGVYCEALTTKGRAKRLIARHGLLVKDRFGQWRANPAVGVARDADATMIRAARALKLDLEPLHDVGRPGREG